MPSIASTHPKALARQQVSQAPSNSSEERIYERTHLCGDFEQKHAPHHRARRPRSTFHILRLLPLVFDILLGAAALLFLVYACLVFLHRGQPAANSLPYTLLRASGYGPTVFPIVFAAIVGRFLRSVAALKLEHGSSVLTMEYLLSSRTVVSALMAPFELRAWHYLVPLLLTAWTFSPLGSQASLRIISKEASYTLAKTNLTYLSYVSNYNMGESGFSGMPDTMSAVYALFTSALLTNEATKKAPQDQYGHVKIPLDQNTVSRHFDVNRTSWYDVPTQDDDVAWSSLQGIPINGLPASGQSEFAINTAYAIADCNVTAEVSPSPSSQILENCTSGAFAALGYGFSSCWSGGSFAIEAFNLTSEYTKVSPVLLNFTSINYWASDPDPSAKPKGRTNALCWVSMNYVEVDTICEGQRCRGRRIRPSQNPLVPILNGSRPRDIRYELPMRGGSKTFYFWSHLVEATVNRELICASGRCALSPLEGYLLDPKRIYWSDGSANRGESIWSVGENLFSIRLTQLINTLWLDSIATTAIVGTINDTYTPGSIGWNLEGMSLSVDGYNFLNTTAIVKTSVDVIRCSIPWFLILLVATILLLLAGIATVIVNMTRKAPDILTNFTSLLRYNQYVSIPQQASLDDSVDIARRLGSTRVLFGNVRPEEDIGYAALTVTGHDSMATKLERRKLYE